MTLFLLIVKRSLVGHFWDFFSKFPKNFTSTIFSTYNPEGGTLLLIRIKMHLFLGPFNNWTPTHRTLYLVSTSQTVTDETLLRDEFSWDSLELETQLLALDLIFFVKNSFFRFIKNKMTPISCFKHIIIVKKWALHCLWGVTSSVTVWDVLALCASMI